MSKYRCTLAELKDACVQMLINIGRTEEHAKAFVHSVDESSSGTSMPTIVNHVCAEYFANDGKPCEAAELVKYQYKRLTSGMFDLRCR